MNIYLLNSSIFFGSLHIYYALSYRIWPLYMHYMTLGIASSILNHAFTDSYLQFADRFIMSLGFIIDTAILVQNNLFDRWLIMTIELLAVMCYMYSKKRESIALHTLAHALITFSHCSILSSAYFACHSYNSIQLHPNYKQLLCM